MKPHLFIVIAILICTTALLFPKEPYNTMVNGDLTFISITGSNNDSFSLRTNIEIPASTVVYFTDSEWNGNHFGADESNVIWNSGTSVIPAGTIISFNTVNTYPVASHGNLEGIMKISSSCDAIFAYVGSHRMPEQFIAAIANNSQAYGTLLNTGLDLGSSAITISNKNPNSFNAHELEFNMSSKPLLTSK